MRTSRREFMACCGAFGAATLLTPAWAAQPAADVRKFHLSVTPQNARARSRNTSGDPPDGRDKDVAHRRVVRRLDLHTRSHEGLAEPNRGRWHECRRIERAARTSRTARYRRPGAAPFRPTERVGPAPPFMSPRPRPTAARYDSSKAWASKASSWTTTFGWPASPGGIGGCFCPEHKQAFLRRTGYGEPQWRELLDAVAHRKPTPVLRAWVDFNCDELTKCFRDQQASVPGGAAWHHGHVSRLGKGRHQVQ